MKALGRRALAAIFFFVFFADLCIQKRNIGVKTEMFLQAGMHGGSSGVYLENEEKIRMRLRDWSHP